MHRLRSTWAAIIGGALLVTLSVSAAFGAPPTGEDAPRGQTVAGFVHELVFGPTEQPEDEELLEEQEEDLEGEGDEEELADELVVEDDLVVDGEVASAHGECVSEEASIKTDETEEEGNHGAVVSFAAQETCWETEDEVEADPEEALEREVPEEFANHGECVSEAAGDHDSEGATEAMTHGKWVSDHARYICWSLEVPTEEETEETTLEGEAEADAAELTAQEERKAEQAAARAERKAAVEAAVAERKAALEAAVAQRKADKAASQGARLAGAGNGGGNGRGGDRP